MNARMAQPVTMNWEATDANAALATRGPDYCETCKYLKNILTKLKESLHVFLRVFRHKPMRSKSMCAGNMY